jgi:hypothetical protein
MSEFFGEFRNFNIFNMNAPFTQIIDIKPGMKRLAVKAIVLNMEYKITTVGGMRDFCEVLIADESASCICKY